MFKRITARRDERGQILLIAAAGMFVFIALVGLVIDTGVAFRERRNIQNAADLSSLAGTKVIADHYLDGGRTGTEVYDAITESLASQWLLRRQRMHVDRGLRPPQPRDHRLGG